MRALRMALAASLGLGLLVGCGKKPEAEAPPQSMVQPKMDETHTTVGVIKAFGEGNKTVVLEHKAFPDGFMEGMTMSFELQDPAMAKGFKVGDSVEFTLKYTGRGFPIVSFKKAK